MDIGTQIQTLLDEQHISRRDFAEKLHIDYNTATGYIKNRRQPDCETLLRISILLNTSTDYLLGRTKLRHHRDLSYSEQESILVNNFRNLPPDTQQLLIRISACLYTTPTNHFSIWKKGS